MKFKVSIKYKVLFSVIFTLICFNFAVTLINILIYTNKEMKKLNEKITANNLIIKSTITETLWNYNETQTRNNLDTFFEDQSIMSIKLIDYSGVLNIDLKKQNMDDSKLIYTDINLEKNNQELGKILVTYTRSGLNTQIYKTVIQMAALTIGLIVINSFVIVIILTIILKPINKILQGISQVKKGNLDFQINISNNDELGVLSESFDEMSMNLRKITASRDELNEEIEIRKKTEKELMEAIAKVRTLSGFLPICTHCKKIRDDKGYWEQIESYIKDHSEVEFSHSLCPDCTKKLYPDLYQKLYQDNSRLPQDE
ncbi:MAG: HAMP domain-containing protein [Spirochaetes bacterium]|nr:HAMP domain-containing protein [Spirochaetota bacterium]